MSDVNWWFGAAGALIVLAVVLGRFLGWGVIDYHRWAWRQMRSCALRGCETPREPGSQCCAAHTDDDVQAEWDRRNFYA